MKKEELLEAGYRQYTGDKLDVYFKSERCIHSGVCVKGNPAVFDLARRPWIQADNGAVTDLTELIDRCPSQALQYVLKDEEPIR